jgi:hypothetical protein
MMIHNNYDPSMRDSCEQGQCLYLYIIFPAMLEKKYLISHVFNTEEKHKKIRTSQVNIVRYFALNYSVF